jgi:hypothetical protein
VGRTGKERAYVLAGLRQVDAHHSIVAKPNVVDAKCGGGHNSQRREQERATPLGELNCPFAGMPVYPHADVGENPRIESAEFFHEVLLSAVDDRPRTVTDQKGVPILLDCLQNGSKEVDSPGKENDDFNVWELSESFLKIKNPLHRAVRSALDKIEGELITREKLQGLNQGILNFPKLPKSQVPDGEYHAE